MVDTELPLSEVVWARESSGLFLGSPSIVALPNSSYLASHDEFGPGGVRRAPRRAAAAGRRPMAACLPACLIRKRTRCGTATACQSCSMHTMRLTFCPFLVANRAPCPEVGDLRATCRQQDSRATALGSPLPQA